MKSIKKVFLDKKNLERLKKIKDICFGESEYKIFIYGSRVTGNHDKYSDIDIGIISRDKLSSLKKDRFKEMLYESKIPYFTDVTDFSKVDESFKKQALNNIYLL
jgi:predicted nucleotidyltransferase